MKIDPKTALERLAGWPARRDQLADDRADLVRDAWLSGVRNVTELHRVADVSRDTIYADLRRRGIDPTDRSAMPTTALSRRAILRGHLNRILAYPPPTNHKENIQLNEAGVTDRAKAVSRQIDQVRILQLLHGRDEVAAAYSDWLDDNLREQVKTAKPLRSWNEVHLDIAPIPRWRRDRHGFLCWVSAGCDESFWQLLPVGGGSGDRMCKHCARAENLSPGEVWEPRLPAAHDALAYRGLMPEEAHENEITLKLTDGTDRSYGLGDTNAFLFAEGWMGLVVDQHQVNGTSEAPHMEIIGKTTKEGHQFSFLLTFDYDATPQGWRRSPYGFRFTSGTLTSSDGSSTHAITDVVELLDTIDRGEAAFPSGPAPTK